MNSGYRGRFAPSPTGDLHFGSLVSAMASFVDAKRHDGSWLIRIDDVDQTRARPDAETSILATLDRFGLISDEAPQRQSDRISEYQQALRQLAIAGSAYRCNCSRKAVAEHGRPGPDGPIYPGTCLRSPPPPEKAAAWRFKIENSIVAFTDRIHGETRQNLRDDVGDFVIFRLDGYCAYQLAVVVDDRDQGITDVVRGADLLSSTPRQIALQQALGIPSPRYAHLPLVMDAKGRKLSKSDGAFPVDSADPMPALRAAWRHLGQHPLPGDVRNSKAFWKIAVQEWRIENVTDVAG